MGSLCVSRGSQCAAPAAHDAEQQGCGTLHSTLRVLPRSQPLLQLRPLDPAVVGGEQIPAQCAGKWAVAGDGAAVGDRADVHPC